MIEFIMSNWQQISLILTTAVTLASLITNLIPGEKDDKIVAKIKKVVDAIALNYKNIEKK